ncbi:MULTISPECIES: AlpA family transcriptional regulator [unclassified Pseudomonas]|uniref:helix-turn-helix transcriptional regulator n=1 Tax=unclassified Pseudomonas TaxID=196821 RepID=UPI000C878437|nr:MULTISPECIES: AlpA family transcriptional regulator [unclassified Pseudomonas]PMU11725.1 AlpA family transcriptional regulator [Pseudomonas sp. FW305-20]PMU15387.1 AlpA family transcriptional regulator [Pseudomonas sp. FW305-122]PMU43230.1 AlpA family transcriptional regulator [Pseudomonas sp. FW305-47B]PMX63521.1 AlpA family transcriptional regulator [Pseudomonas sp. FW305-60]PMX64555.1 AlpA family transcriptional regulator [Pseudomonas sp. FW305-33]
MSRFTPKPFQPVQRIELGNRLLRRREVEQKTGKSRAAIYADIRAGTFPGPMPIGINSVAWLEAEVDQWIAERLAERNQVQLTNR